VAEQAVGREAAGLLAQSGVVAIGVGNELRHDDAAGLEVARRVRSLASALPVAEATESVGGAVARAGAGEIAVLEHEGEPLGLLELWDGARAAVLVDAVRSGATPGTIHRVDVSREPIPALLRGSSSTHAVGVGEAIELARALDRLPQRVVVYGVEGLCFDAGSGLSADVEGVIDSLAEAVLREVRDLASLLRRYV
jgi:hydrogenase maturation protease